MIPVKNETTNVDLIALWIEDQNGRNERCVFFTVKEVEKMTKLKVPMENSFIQGRLYPAFIYGRPTNIIKVVLPNGITIITTLSNIRIGKLEKKAEKLQELTPRKSLIMDMLD